MSVQTREERILTAFSRQVKRDKNLRNGFLLVHSEKHTIDLAIAEGTDRQSRADIQQSVYLASVGKLFTATLIGILSERGHLKIDAPIGRYLDADLMHGLHVLKGKEYSAEITVRHLLMQTSGLYDVFYHFLKKMMKTPGVSITPRDAIEWGKAHLKPAAVPGRKHFYTDTNYHLLGMIVENITGKAFHESLHELIFDPLGMHHAYMHGFSTPRIESGYQTAQAYFHGHDLLSMQGYHQIDYAGGGVVAPLSEYLLFMKALVNHKLLKNETLSRMIEDSRAMGFPVLGFDYGHSIWKLKTIPVLVPRKYQCWGCVGATGAFLFYHPETRSCIIGTFNDFAYRGKALQFMVKSVIKELVR